MSMSTTTENCRYVSLPTPRSFRLLKITNHVQPIKISVRIFEMGSSPKYTAFSYTWGHPVDEDDLGTEKERIHHLFSYRKLTGKLEVFVNLHDAVLQLQRFGHSEYFWIDAICINQSNTEEKNCQVNMMCDIYEQASRVLVWPGQEDESGPGVRGLLNRLAQAAHRAHDLPQKTSLTLPQLARFLLRLPIESDIAIETLGFPDLKDKERQVLSAFFERRWFSRIWVIQEVALAGEVDVL